MSSTALSYHSCASFDLTSSSYRYTPYEYRAISINQPKDTLISGSLDLDGKPNAAVQTDSDAVTVVGQYADFYAYISERTDLKLNR